MGLRARIRGNCRSNHGTEPGFETRVR